MKGYNMNKLYKLVQYKNGKFDANKCLSTDIVALRSIVRSSKKQLAETNKLNKKFSKLGINTAPTITFAVKEAHISESKLVVCDCGKHNYLLKDDTRCSIQCGRCKKYILARTGDRLKFRQNKEHEHSWWCCWQR